MTGSNQFYSMTAHKSQGKIMTKVIVNLKNTHGTEEVYVMISCIKSLDSLLILCSFEKKKIQCGMSEEACTEQKILHHLSLLTLLCHVSPDAHT